MDEIKIPKSLQKEEIRFVLLNLKKPFEKEWQNKGYRYDDPKLLDWISKGNNYGVIGGYGNLRFIDCDDKKFAEELKRKLPPTLTVETGSGGIHFYFFSDYNENHVFEGEKGELR